MTDFIPFFPHLLLSFFLFSWSFCSCGCKAFIRDTKSSVSRTSSLLSVLVDPAFRDDTNQRIRGCDKSTRTRDRSVSRGSGHVAKSVMGKRGLQAITSQVISGSGPICPCDPRGCGGERQKGQFIAGDAGDASSPVL